MRLQQQVWHKVLARQGRVLLAVLGDFIDERELEEGSLGEVGLGSHTRVTVPAVKRGATPLLQVDLIDVPVAIAEHTPRASPSRPTTRRSRTIGC